jgi:hypothetical protein
MNERRTTLRGRLCRAIARRSSPEAAAGIGDHLAIRRSWSSYAGHNAKGATRKALFLVRGGLVLDLLYDWPKLLQRGGVFGAELFCRATQIGVLDGVEHLAC